MITLNGLFIDKSLTEIDKIKKIFNKNDINISVERVNSEEKFMNKLIDSKYDVVISDYPNRSLNFLTLLGLYEIHGKNIPLILLVIENYIENDYYRKSDSGKIVFINKDNIEVIIPRVFGMLNLVH
ncbi:MAG: hypothetical protein ABF289_02860 [Clostridiales bacterium]